MLPPDAARHFLGRIERPARILVAISGGSDSTGLLVALARTAGVHGIFAATVDHALRPESAGEAAGVAALCARLGVPHITLRWEGEKPSSGLSAAARAARYRLLRQAAAHFSADLAVTAHTADDQAETVAMRAARAAGPDNAGLAGMAQATLYDRSLWIARPFLNVRRQAIRDYLTGEGIGWIDDPSNADPHYERVRIRAALAEGRVQAPDAALAAEKRTRLADAAAAWVSRHATLGGGALARIGPEGLGESGEVLRFALAGLIATLGGRENGPSSEAMARLLDLIAAGVPGRMTLGRVFVALRRDGLYLMRERRGLPDLVLPPGGEGVWDGRFVIRNPLAEAVCISPAGAPDAEALAAAFPGLPASLAARAAQALPRIAAPAALPVSAVSPRIAPYDLFLPCFDLSFANSLAFLFGRETFTEPMFTR